MVRRWRGATVRPQWEKVDGMTLHRRRRLQAVRAEAQACRRVAERLDGEMADARMALDAAVAAYERGRADLSSHAVKAHGRLAAALDGRSAAEVECQRARDRVKNVLQAERTACTVRAYRLDARWRRLDGRYRGFVTDVLDPTSVEAAERRYPRPPTGDRRFFAVADEFGARYRRESLRTSRSLRVLATGFLRDVTPGPQRARQRSSATAVLDGAGPERVLDRLSDMQAQCARIAERVRKRDGCAVVRRPAAIAAVAVDASALAEARRLEAEGREYLRTVRSLADAACAEVHRRDARLRRLLCDACAACTGRRDARPADTATAVAGRLERACFTLFARLDEAHGSNARPQQAREPGRWTETCRAPATTVVALCLRAVQTNRRDAMRRAHDVAVRVQDFRKAVVRLLSATTATAAAATHGSAATDDRRRVSRTPSDGRRSAVSVVPSTKKNSAVKSPAAALTEVAAVTFLCPPSFGAVEYK